MVGRITPEPRDDVKTVVIRNFPLKFRNINDRPLDVRGRSPKVGVDPGHISP